MAGRRVREDAGGGVQDAVEDRGTFDVVHEGGEGVQVRQHGRGRGVPQRRGPHRTAQPAHGAGRRDAVPDGVADHEGELPVAQRHRVVPVAAGVPDRRRLVVAARQREIGEHREEGREQRGLRGLDRLRRGDRPWSGIDVVVLDDRHRAGLARDGQGPDDDRHRGPALTQRTAERLGPAGAGHLPDHHGEAPAVDGRHLVQLGAQPARAGVRPDRAPRAGQAVDGGRRGLHRLEQHRGPVRSGGARTGELLCVVGAHLPPGNSRPQTSATAPEGPWGRGPTHVCPGSGRG